MIPVRINFPGQTANAIAAAQSITATAGGGVVLNGTIAPPGNIAGSASTGIGGPYSKPVILPGVARPITITATGSATNAVFRVVGLDLRGNTITASFIGASGGSTSATDTTATGSGTDFHIVQGIVTTASVGSFTVGFGATGVTNFYKVSQGANPQGLSIGGLITATTTTYTVELTYDNIETTTTPVVATTSPIANAVTTLVVGLTATSLPVTGVRGVVSTNSASGGVIFVFTQSGR